MVKMVPRRGWLRLSFLGLLAACALVYVYYYSSTTNPPHLMKDGKLQQQQDAGRAGDRRAERQSVVVDEGRGQTLPSAQCRAITAPTTDVNTVDQFPKFEFQVSGHDMLTGWVTLLWLTCLVSTFIKASVFFFFWH